MKDNAAQSVKIEEIDTSHPQKSTEVSTFAWGSGEVVRLGLVAAGVSVSMHGLECVGDIIFKAKLEGGKVTWGGMMASLLTKGMLSPLPSKVAAALNKTTVRRGSDLSKESLNSEQHNYVVDEHSSTSSESNQTQDSFNGKMIVGLGVQQSFSNAAIGFGVMTSYGVIEAIMTGSRSADATQKTEKAIYNPEYEVIERPLNLKDRVHYRLAGISSKSLRNLSQIVIIPASCVVKESLIAWGMDSGKATVGATIGTGIMFSPFFTITGMIYRNQVISMDPKTFRTISFWDAAKKIPAEFLKDSVKPWKLQAAYPAVLTCATIATVNYFESKIDESFVPQFYRSVGCLEDRVEKSMSSARVQAMDSLQRAGDSVDDSNNKASGFMNRPSTASFFKSYNKKFSSILDGVELLDDAEDFHSSAHRGWGPGK